MKHEIINGVNLVGKNKVVLTGKTDDNIWTARINTGGFIVEEIIPIVGTITDEEGLKHYLHISRLKYPTGKLDLKDVK